MIILKIDDNKSLECGMGPEKSLSGQDVADGIYRVSDLGEEETAMLVEFVDKPEYHYLFDSEAINEAWARFAEDFYDTNRELLCDTVIGYLIDGAPEFIGGSFRRLYMDNQKYIKSRFGCDEDLLAIIDLNPEDLNVNFDLPEELDLHSFRVSFSTRILCPAEEYITDLMVEVSDYLDSSWKIYVFEIRGGELVKVYLNREFFHGDVNSDLII